LAKIIDRRTRGGELQLIDGEDAQIGKLSATQDRRGDRRLLQVRVPAFRRDHDLRQLIPRSGGCRRYRLRGSGTAPTYDERGCAQAQMLNFHGLPLCVANALSRRLRGYSH